MIDLSLLRRGQAYGRESLLPTQATQLNVGEEQPARVLRTLRRKKDRLDLFGEVAGPQKPTRDIVTITSIHMLLLVLTNRCSKPMQCGFYFSGVQRSIVVVK